MRSRFDVSGLCAHALARAEGYSLVTRCSGRGNLWRVKRSASLGARHGWLFLLRPSEMRLTGATKVRCGLLSIASWPHKTTCCFFLVSWPQIKSRLHFGFREVKKIERRWRFSFFISALRTWYAGYSVGPGEPTELSNRCR